jgi:glycosyltransferase involved in cell wall biosynthesis
VEALADRDAVAVLIPVHNGGDELAGVLERLEGLGLAVWVSDDGSTDGTARLARAWGSRVVRSERRSGKGAALRRGLAAIRAEGRARWVVLMDGDGQHLPEEVLRFLAAMDESVELLLGTRMGQSHKFPSYRLVPNRIGSRILRWMSGQAVPDTQCGFRAARVSLLHRLELESDGFEVETEMLLKAMRLGARWRAVPVSAVYDGQPSHYRPVHDTFRICMCALRHVR